MPSNSGFASDTIFYLLPLVLVSCVSWYNAGACHVQSSCQSAMQVPQTARLTPLSTVSAGSHMSLASSNTSACTVVSHMTESMHSSMLWMCAPAAVCSAWYRRATEEAQEQLVVRFCDVHLSIVREGYSDVVHTREPLSKAARHTSASLVGVFWDQLHLSAR